VEPLTRLDELRHGLRQPRRRHAERGGGSRRSVAHLAHLTQRADSGHGLEATDAGADRLLLGDEEQADVAGAVAVRSPAELTRRTPSTTFALITMTPGAAVCVSATIARPSSVVIVPRSPTWPPPSG